MGMPRPPRDAITIKKLVPDAKHSAKPKVGRIQLGDEIAIRATVTRHDDRSVTALLANGMRVTFDLLDDSLTLEERPKAMKPANIYANTDD